MADRREEKTKRTKERRRPPTTPEARENQMIAMAFNLAEKQLSEGTASAQVISHFLKLGSSREKLEQENLATNNKLLVTKTEIIESQKRVEELYVSALNAMRSYSGQGPIEPDDEYDDEYQD